MQKKPQLHFIKNTPKLPLRSPELSFEHTKSIKKHKYLEASNKTTLSTGTQTVFECSEEDIQKELASYLKEIQNKKGKKPQYRWEEMTVGTQDLNKTLTVINHKSQYIKDNYKDIFSDSDDSTKGFQEFKYKGDDASDSGTQSIKSSETEIVVSVSHNRKKDPKNDKNAKKSDSSSDSSELINFAMSRKTQLQTTDERSFERKAKKTVNYNELDDDEQLWQFIMEQNDLKAKKSKKPRKFSQDNFKKSRHSSPPVEVNRFDKKKNKYLVIESPEQISKKPSNSISRKTIVVSNRKNRESSNSLSKILGINRESEYKVKRLKKEKQQENTCSICLCDIEQRSRLPCKHCFCRPCLIDWIDKTSNCPNCRKDAAYYTFNGEKFEIQQKAYSLENYVDNIGDDSDEGEIVLDSECYNCDHTMEGDQLLVCDRCLVNASHVLCDRSLKGREPAADRQWFCHVCRAQPNTWWKQMRNY